MSNTCKNIAKLTQISRFKTFCLSKAVAICGSYWLYKNAFILQKLQNVSISRGNLLKNDRFPRLIGMFLRFLS